MQQDSIGHRRSNGVAIFDSLQQLIWWYLTFLFHGQEPFLRPLSFPGAGGQSLAESHLLPPMHENRDFFSNFIEHGLFPMSMISRSKCIKYSTGIVP